MQLSMYQVCVPVVTQMLNGLTTVLDKAAAHVAEHKLEESAVIQARLYPDMFPMGRQVKQATDFARNAPGRLAGVTSPTFPDADSTFVQLQDRVTRSLAFVSSFTPAQLDGTEDKEISWKAGERQMSYRGQEYLLHFCLPHFFFHVTTAYAILRHNGVEVGKRDYMGSR